MDRKLYLEVLGKLEEAYIAAVPQDERPSLDQDTCSCPAFSFTHRPYACDGHTEAS